MSDPILRAMPRASGRRNALRHGVAAVAAILATCAAGSAFAQATGGFPSRPLRIVVPFAAGTGSDVVARVIGQKVAEQLGQALVVENIVGASGLLATQQVQKAPADGHTLMLAANPFTISPGMYATPPYDPVKDFVPVAKVGDVPIVLTAGMDAPFKTFAELVSWAKANPGKATYASSGKGTPSQLETELFKQAAGIDILEIPYKNTAQALTDVIGGQVSMYPSALPLALANIRAGKVRALAIIDARRTPPLPDVPTLAEALGQPSYVATPLWYGFVAPAGTPKDVVARLHAEMKRAAQVPEVRERLVGLGAQFVDVSNDEFLALMRAEIERSSRLIKALGIRAD